MGYSDSDEVCLLSHCSPKIRQWPHASRRLFFLLLLHVEHYLAAPRSFSFSDSHSRISKLRFILLNGKSDILLIINSARSSVDVHTSVLDFMNQPY